MEKLDYENFEMLMAEAGRFHGDICPGISIGTRMTMIGLRSIGITDPKGADRKKIMVFVEIDRCIADAVMALTGCRPGKRTMKVKDYGKMAATFINLETGKAVRLAAAMRKGERGLEDIATAPDEELFSIAEVEVPLLPDDMPGKPTRRVTCSSCGEAIMDGRDIEAGGGFVCKPCQAEKNYYRVLAPVN
jgi:formylmethanofuran dehydrogenase subunit E